MSNSNKSKGESKKYDSIESYKKAMKNEVVRLSKQSLRRQIDNEIKGFNSK